VARKLKISAELTAQIQPVAPTTKTVSEAVTLFLQACRNRGLSEFTVSSYEKELKAFRKYVPEDAFARITVEDVNQFVEDQLAEGFATTTINTRITTVKLFYRYCVKLKWIMSNPTESLSLLKTRHIVGATFTKAQASKILAQPDLSTFTGLRDYAILLTFLHTGVRLSELAAINVQDVSLSEQSVNVQRTKNRYARRIPMSKRLREVLTVYMKARGIVDGEDALFLTGNDTRLSTRQIQYQLKRHGDKVGISCNPHVFRRTFAKEKIQAGVDVFRVQALMGHSDLDVLKRYYAIFSKDLDDIIERGL
jgi:integrase/recombinase XerD